jgi:2-(1,2-epoxy-1,2-dihydrophenyl)acetyl-CoA isomerase
MSYHGFELSIEGAVALIELDRPHVGNALDVPMTRSLMEAAIRCDDDDAIRCVLITGRGRMFCAGGDIEGFKQAGDGLQSYIKEVTGYLHLAVARFARMRKPVVTAVNGAAAGAGFGLAMLGDIVIAADTASFSLAYPGIGFTPDGGMSWLLPRLVGLRKAQEIVLLNPRIRADEALRIGLITRVTAAGELQAAASEIAAQLAASATSALGETRRLMLEAMTSPLETQLERESRAISEQSTTANGREGIAAFLGGRPPVFV